MLFLRNIVCQEPHQTCKMRFWSDEKKNWPTGHIAYGKKNNNKNKKLTHHHKESNSVVKHGSRRMLLIRVERKTVEDQ